MTGALAEGNVESELAAPEKVDLQEVLDEQLERYLDLVNKYQILQQNLGTVLSSVR